MKIFLTLFVLFFSSSAYAAKTLYSKLWGEPLFCLPLGIFAILLGLYFVKEHLFPDKESSSQWSEHLKKQRKSDVTFSVSFVIIGIFLISTIFWDLN